MDGLVDFFIKSAVMLAFLGIACLAAVWALLKGLKPRSVILVGTLTLCLLLVAIFLLMQSAYKQDTLPALHQYFTDAWTHQSQWLKESGFSQDKIDLFKDIYERYIFQAFPAWLAVNSLLLALLAYYLCSSLLSRVTRKVVKPISFRDWVVPEPLVFGLITGGLFKVIPFFANGPLDILGSNLLVFFIGLYTLSGLSIVSFFFHKWRLPPALRILSYLLLLNLVFETICFFGVLDVWFDFRKLKRTTPESMA